MEKLKSVAELLGMGAVVASLLLVVFELRQTQVAISAAAHSDRTLRNIELLRFAAENRTDEIVSKLDRGEELLPAQRQILDALLQMRMRHFEDLYFQHEIGVVSDETWEANMEGLLWTTTTEPFELEWPKVRRFHRSDFVELVGRISESH